MKKYLVGLIVALVLTGCGAKSDGDAVPKDENAGQIVLNDGTTDGGGQSTNIPEREPVPYRYESEVVRFEIQGVNPDAPEGYELKLLFENKIDGAELYFALEEFAVQRWLSDTYKNYIFEQGLGSETGVVTVEPLSVKEFSVYLDRDALSDLGIKTVDEIGFHLRAWNWDYTGNSVAYEEGRVYPTGLDADSIVVSEAVRSEEFLAEAANDSISVSLLGFEVNESGKLQAKYLVQNKRDVELFVELPGGNRMLNGESYDSLWLHGFYLSGNMRSYVDVNLNHEEIAALSDIVSAEQVNSYETTIMLYYYDEAQNYQTEELRLVY